MLDTNLIAPTRDRIAAAAARLKGVVRRTPLLSSPFLDEIAGRPLHVKAECLQHTGSFKFRGGFSAVSALPEGTRGVLSYSSGNHAQGVARAAQLHDLPAVIVMPHDAPAQKRNNTVAMGAEIVGYDRQREDREAIGDPLAEARGLHLIRPYDDADVIAGQASVGFEIAEQAAEAGVTGGTVITCCGGGGLTAGVALALEEAGPSFTVHSAEPEGYDDAARSLAAGYRMRNQAQPPSLCDAILTPEPGAVTFPIMQRLCGPGAVVTEDEALHAMALAFARLKIVIEPGGAVALAAALFHGEMFGDGPIIAVATGGNVEADVFADALRRFPL